MGIGPIQVFVTPDNRRVLVANQGTESDPSTTVSIVDTTTFSVVNTVETGKGAHGIVIEPSGRYAYITNIYGNSVATLDLTSQQVIATIPTGTGPNGISFSPIAASPAPAAEIALAVTPTTAEMNMGGNHALLLPPTPDSQGQMSGMDMQSATGTTGAAATSEAMNSMDMGGGHAMEAISSDSVPPATQNVGGQPLDYVLDNGVKVFELTARPVLWQILPDVTVTAWTYNGTVPGPMIRVTEGDRVRIVLKNELPEATTIHWHGIEVPNAMDGVPGVTQNAVEPGQSFTYEFVAKPAGTFMYHSHVNGDTQVGLGLYAPFIIDPAKPTEPKPDVDVSLMLSEWRVVNGQTYPAMPMAGAEPNYFTINGKSFPATETVNVKLGQRVRLRIANIGQFVHPMHLHGIPFQIVATDGHPVPEAARLTKDTISIAPGERYDIEFVATEPGQWMLHCHILHHTTNDNVDPGGLITVINVEQ